MVGRVTFRALYILIDEYLASDQSLIIECPFFAKFAVPEIKRSLLEHRGKLVEIYCTLAEDIRRQRIQKRLEEGSRHAQHIAGDTSSDKSEAELLITYAPLKLGDVIEVDTEHFGESQCKALVLQVEKLVTS